MELLNEIDKMLERLDQIQELDIAQNDNELMWELGEAIGSLNNVRDIIEELCD